MFSALGATLGNIDDSPIKLTGLKLKHCNDNINGLINKLIKHYKS